VQNTNGIPKPDQNHTRINDTLLGNIEKKTLLWLAARMPAWVVPDTLTLIGLIASIVIFLSYALTYFHKGFLWLASFAFILNWFGDSLDGTLARYRKIERPRYGFFVDHIIDSVSEVLIFIGLGLSPFLRFDLALLALVGYMLLATYVYLVTYVNGVFRISYARLGPTETRVLAIVANTLVFFSANPRVDLFQKGPAFLQVSLTYYDLVAVFFIGLVVAIFISSAVTTAASLSREDRIAARAKRLSRRQAHQEQREIQKAIKNQGGPVPASHSNIEIDQ
jgi:phosphatidylglycerophosphate synthase